MHSMCFAPSRDGGPLRLPLTGESGLNSRRGGLFYGLIAYGSWGLYPAYFPLLKPAGALEVLAHRIVWTMLLMAVVLVVLRRVPDLRSITRRTWLLLVAASALICVNWGVYVYAVSNSHVVDAALGYFINPLVSVLFGVVIFGERLSRAQVVAVLIAATAVIVMSVTAGTVPVIGLVLAFSFALYGAVKKVVPVEPGVSVGLEAVIAAPFALGVIAVLAVTGGGAVGNYGTGQLALMVLTGPITAIPLLCFAAAAQRLPLVTLGLLQYLTPSMQMILGVVVAHEPMPAARWIGFGLIWTALAVFSADTIVRNYRSRAVP
jgi:chloramphenicol-sensitive protein RarD